MPDRQLPTFGFSLKPWRGGDRPDDGLSSYCAGDDCMTGRSDEIPQDLRILVRIVSVCTLGLWAFAAGLLIGVFLFS